MRVKSVDRVPRQKVMSDLVQAFEEGVTWLQGDNELRVTTLEVPDAPPSYTPDNIRAIRTRNGLSQELFSRHLSISTKTLQAWEQGLRKPSGIASRFFADHRARSWSIGLEQQFTA